MGDRDNCPIGQCAVFAAQLDLPVHHSARRRVRFTIFPPYKLYRFPFPAPLPGLAFPRPLLPRTGFRRQGTYHPLWYPTKQPGSPYLTESKEEPPNRSTGHPRIRRASWRPNRRCAT